MRHRIAIASLAWAVTGLSADLNRAIDLNREAAALVELREYGKAEALYRQALALEETALGREDPRVAQGLTSLAETLYGQGRYAEAEPLCRRALGIRERVLGPDHPEVAFSLNNLGEIERVRSRFVAAEPLFRRALSILDRHSETAQATARTLNNLAAVYSDLGYHEKAVPLYYRSLGMAEKAAGPRSNEAAAVWNNLAVSFLAQRKHRQAEDSVKRALAIEESEAALVTYAEILRNTRRKTEAIKIDARLRELHANRGSEAIPK